MKSIVLGFCLTILANLAFSQDVCSELIKFSSYEKNNNRTMRMTSKTAMMGQTQIMERDKEGNMYQIVKMEMGARKIQMETITWGSTTYTSQNGKDWQTRVLDSVQLNAMKNQWKNNQLHYFKNCEKKDNQTIDGKKYSVYTAEFDLNQMQETMKNSKSLTEEEKMTMEQMTTAMSAIEMKMTMFINDKDDLEITKNNMSMKGKDFESFVTFEYDINIKVSPPPMNVLISVPSPSPAKNKN